MFSVFQNIVIVNMMPFLLRPKKNMCITGHPTDLSRFCRLHLFYSVLKRKNNLGHFSSNPKCFVINILILSVSSSDGVVL